MKTVSIDHLKKHLSALIAEAESGEKIVVTRHQRPVATLSAAGGEHVHLGRGFGKEGPKPLFSRATRGKYLDALDEDRRGSEKD